MKKILFLAAMFIMISAANVKAQTWQIGYPTASNVTATLNNGTLTISGTGAMQDFQNWGPWNLGTNSSDMDHITNVVINNGVTTIGNNAFSTAHNLASVTIPNSITNIGKNAFYNCLSLILLDIPNGVTTIEEGAFSSCYGLISISIPASVSSIGQYAFSTASGSGSSMHLTDVTVNWTSPFFVPSNTFFEINLANIQLHTPSGTESAYAVAPVWQNFNIVGSQAYLKVSPTSYSFSANSGTSPAIIIVSNQSWSVSDNASWLTTSRTSASNNNTFTMTAQSNSSTSSRSATVTVSGGGISRTISVTQDGNLPVSTESTVNAGSGRQLTFLSYNLGASQNMTIAQQIAYTPSSNTDATVYGDLYQWGRRTDGHEKRNSSTTTTLSSTDVPGHSYFIFRYDNDYVSDWRSPKNDNLWGATKTTNDPCPSGYRVPTLAEWTSVVNNNTWTWTGNGYKISPDGGNTYTMFLSAGGARPNNIIDPGIEMGYGDYWSSTIDSEGGAKNLHFHSTWVYPGISGVSIGRIHGYCLRCVKEEGAITSTLTVSPTTYNFVASGGTSSTISITSNQSWTISDNADWLTTSKTSGSNNSTFTMTATANTGATRTATVTIIGGGITRTINVTQNGVGFDVSPTSYNFVASGGTSSTITVASGQSWTVSDNASWLTTSKTSGSSTDYFTMTATENTSTAIRSAIVTVSSGGTTKTISITQDAAILLTVSQSSYNFTSSGGASSAITITSNQNWTISDNASWLTTSRTSGSNDNYFTMTATANAAASLRSAIVTITGGGITRVINVVQDGVSNCSVEPLLPTQWNQRAPYNNLVNSNLGGDYPTGCVATAMAQIMDYWQYPTSRTVRIEGYTTRNNHIVVPSITGITTYDWANMKNTTAEYTTTTQKNAVAKLMYECGVSVEMDYKPSGSGAYVETNLGPAVALPTNFNYDNQIDVKYNRNYNANTWNALLREELDASRPIFYAGFGTGGHAFVCDGYRNCSNENLFHFNWGWGGSADGWFVTSVLNPSQYDFSEDQRVIINIKPNESVNFFEATDGDEGVLTITASKGSGGILIPNGTATVYPYTNKIYVFEPNEGYEIDQVKIDGVANETAKANGYYIFQNVTATHSIIVTFKAATSAIIPTKTDNLNLTIFPNPAKDEIFIKSDLQIGKVEIYSLTGTLLLIENNFNGKISVSVLPQGVYLLRVYTDKGVAFSKIVKE